MAGNNPLPPLQMPYLASLNIPDLSKLTNDFPFPSPPQPMAPPQGHPHAGVNFVQPSPVQQYQNFEQPNTKNLTHPLNNAKNKGKKMEQ
jgi:hypothetical protein